MPVSPRRTDAAPIPGSTVQYVIDTLTTRIVAQEYGLDERLPAERQLAQDLGVARNTVREALDQLEERGMIRRRAGSGSFVIWDPEGTARSVAPVAAGACRSAPLASSHAGWRFRAWRSSRARARAARSATAPASPVC